MLKQIAMDYHVHHMSHIRSSPICCVYQFSEHYNYIQNYALLTEMCMYKDEQVSRSFANLMFQGKTSSALRLLN